MKIVLDTNVFISGVFFSGPPYQILNAWRQGRFEMAISQDILNEYYRVAEELSVRYSQIQLSPILEYVFIHAELFLTTTLPEPVCVDPDDDKFLACALASGSSIVVSGDKHLLDVSGYQGILVMTPRQFVETHLQPFHDL